MSSEDITKLINNMSLTSDEPDLIFRVGDDNDAIEFNIKASVIGAHSPAFRAMLSGPWAETQKAGKPIRLPEDDPAAFGTIVHILSNLALEDIQDDTPPEPEALMPLADFCDKWDFAKLVRPWMEKWVQGYGEAVFHADERCYIA